MDGWGGSVATHEEFLMKDSTIPKENARFTFDTWGDYVIRRVVLTVYNPKPSQDVLYASLA